MPPRQSDVHSKGRDVQIEGRWYRHVSAQWGRQRVIAVLKGGPGMSILLASG